MININNLSKTYKINEKKQGLKGSICSLFKKDSKHIKALESINLTIKQGEFIGLIGLNGAGKTTLIKLMTGLLYPDNDNGNNINVLNKIPYKKEKSFLKEISLVSGQKNQLLWDLTAMDSFLLNKEIYGIKDDEFNETLDYLTKLLNIKEKLNVQVRKLSLGQRMKLEIISALLHKPKILFLDEPTIGLDIISQKNLREFLKEYNKRNNATIVLTSHNIDDISELCNRVVFLNKGKIIFDVEEKNLKNNFPIMNYKIITINYSSDKEINLEEIREYCNIIFIDQNNLKLKVHTNHISKITSFLCNNLIVNDISISENSLDDVITYLLNENN